MMVNNEPWFRVKDVAAALGYANPHQAIRHNVDERDRSQRKDLMVLKFSTIPECVESPEYHEGAQVFISETGLYPLILSSPNRGQGVSALGYIGGPAQYSQKWSVYGESTDCKQACVIGDHRNRRAHQELKTALCRRRYTLYAKMRTGDRRP